MTAAASLSREQGDGKDPQSSSKTRNAQDKEHLDRAWTVLDRLDSARACGRKSACKSRYDGLFPARRA